MAAEVATKPLSLYENRGIIINYEERRKRGKGMHIEWLDWTFSLPRIVDAFVKMTLALVCGGVIGLERGRKKRPAGFRTYMLVCLGATLVMMTNDFLCENGHGVDVARLGA